MANREEITIQGETFTVDSPYTAGAHELTEGEASALNQTRAENLRNNFAKKVKDAKEAGSFDLAAFQAQFDEYASKYEFGVRQGGTGAGRQPSDPVKREALKIGVEFVANKLKAQGKTIGPKGNHTMAQVRETAAAILDRHPEWTETARARVEENKALAASGDDGIDLESLMTETPAKDSTDGSAPTAPVDQAA